LASAALHTAIVLGFLGLAATARAGGFATFDAPGAAHGTVPVAINADGTITGYYVDASDAPHGFLRAPNGDIVTFDVPDHAGTTPRGLNDEGTVVGTYTLKDSTTAAFLMAPDGKFTRFHFDRNLTIPAAINSSNDVAGYFGDFVNGTPGFVRHSDGTKERFNPGGDPSNLTYTCCINGSGEVAGSVLIYGGESGFVRTADGTITTFYVADGEGPISTESKGLTAAGAITGNYWFSSNRRGKNLFHGFVRAPDGAISTFDLTGGKGNTFPCCINDVGNIVGYVNQDWRSPLARGFRRSPDGTYITFKVPGGVQGTVPLSMNTSSVVTGYYIDSASIAHGFVGTP
jgi:hypothetical protein